MAGVAEAVQEGSEGALIGLSIDLQMEAAGDLDRDYGKTAATEGIIGSIDWAWCRYWYWRCKHSVLLG